MTELEELTERLLQLANDEGTAQIHDVAVQIASLAPRLGSAPKRTDTKTLERLADQIKIDASSGRGLNPSALFSIVDIIQRAIGAPLMWPSRSAGADAADAYYRGDPDLRHAFNAGVKWAVEQYHDLNLDQVRPR